jgi:hypothetical protein
MLGAAFMPMPVYLMCAYKPTEVRCIKRTRPRFEVAQ